MIRRNIELEARLIDDLLDLTRIARGNVRLELAAVDAHKVMENVIDTCRHEVDAKRLRLDAGLKAAQSCVRADRARLQQVLWNILQNAVKFTPSGGTITVRSWNADGPEAGQRASGNHSDRPTSRSALCIEIADTGVGIPPEVLPRIFDAFEQGEVIRARRYGGLGLGLAICKTLVEMQGGTIAAESQGPGRGTTLRVQLPVHCEQPAAPLPKPPTQDASRALRILLVEDHETTAALMTRLLKMMHHDVQPAGNVRDALKLADQGRFDLVISDIGLPDGTGADLMRELRQRHGLNGIALSGYGMERDIRNSLEAGFSAHLVKPVSVSQLEAALREVSELVAAH